MINIKINNHHLNQIEYYKFLGIIFDNKLNWKRHIKFVLSKLNKLI